MADRSQKAFTLTLVYAMSADGKIASYRRESPELGGVNDRRWLEEQMAEADAILHSQGEIEAAGGALLIKGVDLIQARTAKGKPAAGPSFAPRARARSTARAASSTRAGSMAAATLRTLCASYCFKRRETYASAAISPRAIRATASRAPISSQSSPNCGRANAAATRLAIASGAIAAAAWSSRRREASCGPSSRFI